MKKIIAALLGGMVLCGSAACAARPEQTNSKHADTQIHTEDTPDSVTKSQDLSDSQKQENHPSDSTENLSDSQDETMYSLDEYTQTFSHTKP